MKIQLAQGNSWGNALLVAVVVAGVTGVALVSYLSYLSTQSVLTVRSQAWNAALPLVEAGVEEAITHLTASPKNWPINGWSGSNAFIQLERALGEGYYSVTVSNRETPFIISRGYVRAPLSTNYVSRAVRVELIMKPEIGPGLGAKGTIDLNGNKLVVDSFDSSDPAYSDAFGMYTDKERKDGVTVASNLGVTDAINSGNADIWGRVATGPGGSVEALKNGVVGSTSWHQNAANKGIEPGYSSTDADIPFPPIIAPASGTSPTVDLLGNIVLANDVYEVTSLTSKLVVTGNATLIVRTTFSLSGTDAIIINPGASLKLYVYAANASFGSGSYNCTAGSRATNLRYFGMPSNTTVEFIGNTSFGGVLYAPDADFYANGGGSGLNFSGSALTKSVKMNGGYTFHFDEALLKEAAPGFVITRWDEI